LGAIVLLYAMVPGLIAMAKSKLLPNVNAQNKETVIIQQKMKAFVTVMQSLWYKIGWKTW
jgi:hypothetical protein